MIEDFRSRCTFLFSFVHWVIHWSSSVLSSRQ